jgi:Cu(I)/Ag(I) efflux system membrane protein CusA/SilA
MIARIIEYSIRNKLLVLIVTGVVITLGVYAMLDIPLDAIPDLSDVQVIIFSEYPGQAPQVVEDQVTYPLTTRMLSVPFAKTVRGYSFFGFSFVYVIFEDGTDLYWARSRVLEYLSSIQGRLPPGARVELGPDATGVGWIYEYVLRSDRHSLHELRSIQDWFLRYELTSVEGVAEVASIGGYVKQYQVTVDPVKLQAFDLSIERVGHAIRRSNTDVGGRLVEMAETEFMVRGLGYFQSVADIESVPVTVDPQGTPILIKDVAAVTLGPELRRGVAELDGGGEVVGGIIVMRLGENALATIQRVREKLDELRAGLPEGVEVVPVYDRSDLIQRSIRTLRRKLGEEMLIVAIVSVLFLLHFRSALVAIFTLPVGILISFIVMYGLDINANIMSLGGIAIAIGVMVDASIVMVENAHKHLERLPSPPATGAERDRVMLAAAREVGPALFFSLVIITLSFLPVFTLQAQEGRLFSPLAFTKTFAMAGASLLAITTIPVLMCFFVRGRIRHEKDNPISRFFIRVYRPFIHFVLHYPKTVIVTAVLVTVLTWMPYSHLGAEFIPPLFEGDFLWMPTTDPGISIAKAKELLQQTDKILARFPEVEHVFGKIGRAETSTDPAPLSMIETTIQLKPEDEWPQRTIDRWYRRVPMPEAFRSALARLWPEFVPERTPAELDRAINEAIRFPGLTNAGMEGPIKIRLDMLTTGIRAPVGIKIAGPDLAVLQDLAQQAAQVVGQVGRRPLPRFRDRPAGGGPLRSDHRRRPGRDHDRHRRHEHHPDGRGPGALPGEPALPAGAARQSRRPAPGAGRRAARRSDPPRASRRSPDPSGSPLDQERERPTECLGAGQHPRGRDRHRDLCPPGAPGGGGPGRDPAGVLGPLERPL